MEKIKNFFKNRKKIIDLTDSEEYNNLLQKLNFVKEQETAPLFLNKSEVVEQNKSEVVEQDDFHQGDMEMVDHYDGTR